MSRLVVGLVIVFMLVPVQGLMEQRTQQDRECTALRADRAKVSALTVQERRNAEWKCGSLALQAPNR